MQIHFSGGEPTARGDLEALVERAHAVDLYTNLITAGVMLSGLGSTIWSRPDSTTFNSACKTANPPVAIASAAILSAYKRKMEFAALVRRAGLPLTLNVVVHRQNLRNLQSMISLAVELGARRLEVAHVSIMAGPTETARR